MVHTLIQHAKETCQAAKGASWEAGLSSMCSSGSIADGSESSSGSAPQLVLWLDSSSAAQLQQSEVPLNLAYGWGNEPPPLVSAVLAGDMARLDQLLHPALALYASTGLALLLNSRWSADRLSAAIERQHGSTRGSMQIQPGCTLLLAAASLGRQGVMECLLAHGADAGIWDDSGLSPLSAALTSCSQADQAGGQHMALVPQLYAAVEQLCMAGGLLPSDQHPASTAATDVSVHNGGAALPGIHFTSSQGSLPPLLHCAELCRAGWRPSRHVVRLLGARGSPDWKEQLAGLLISIHSGDQHSFQPLLVSLSNHDECSVQHYQAAFIEAIRCGATAMAGALQQPAQVQEIAADLLAWAGAHTQQPQRLDAQLQAGLRFSLADVHRLAQRRDSQSLAAYLAAGKGRLQSSLPTSAAAAQASWQITVAGRGTLGCPILQLLLQRSRSCVVRVQCMFSASTLVAFAAVCMAEPRFECCSISLCRSTGGRFLAFCRTWPGRRPTCLAACAPWRCYGAISSAFKQGAPLSVVAAWSGCRMCGLAMRKPQSQCRLLQPAPNGLPWCYVFLHRNGFRQLGWDPLVDCADELKVDSTNR